MRCRVCRSPRTRPFTVSGVILYSCEDCKAGMVGPRHPRSPLTLNSIYSFRDYDRRRKQFKKRAREIISCVGKWKRTGRVLDVGAGFGLLSAEFAKRGYEVTCLEPRVKPVYALKQKGVRIIKKTAEDFARRRAVRFDVVVLMDVLEHVDDPGNLLRLLGRLLNKQGIILVQTPNHRSLMRYAVAHWAWWMFEDHRVFLSTQSLRMLARVAQLRLVEHRTYEDYEDMMKQFEGWFTPIRTAYMRKALKIVALPLFVLVYRALRAVVWKMGWGGLHVAVLQNTRE